MARHHTSTICNCVVFVLRICRDFVDPCVVVALTFRCLCVVSVPLCCLCVVLVLSGCCLCVVLVSSLLFLCCLCFVLVLSLRERVTETHTTDVSTQGLDCYAALHQV